MKYLRYLKYILIHKFYVLIECFKMGLYWRGIIHDMSKLLPSEFIPYANHFFGDEGNRNCNKIRNVTYDPNKDSDQPFQMAWHYHSSRNKHHWQYWVTPTISGGQKPFPIPIKYIKEMLCDWEGAKKAKGTTMYVPDWWRKNKKDINLHPKTEEAIDVYLGGK